MPRNLFPRARVRLGGLLCMVAAIFYASSASAQQTVTLAAALSRTLSAEPAVAASRSRAEGARLGVAQADRFVNPSVGLEVENFAGGGVYRRGGQTEGTVFLEQKIERGQKREARTALARTEIAAVRARGLVYILDRLRDAELAWVEAIAAEARLRVARERLSYSKSLREEIARRSEAGGAAAFALARADAQVALDQLAVDQAATATKISKSALAAFWKGSGDIRLDPRAFNNTKAIGPEEGSNPEVALLAAEREAAAARINFAISLAAPDPSLRVGVRRIQETHDTTVLAGVAIPLTIFDDNSAAIAKAQAERRAAEADATSARAAVRREAKRLHSEMQAAAREAKQVRTDVLPGAQRAVGLIREGLERGGFSYVELNDAQRTLNEARLLEITTLKKFHTDRAALARLTGRHARAFNLTGETK